MKKIFYVFICVLGFIVFNYNVKAYDLFTYYGTIYSEEIIYNEFSKIEDFNINNYSNIYCTYYKSSPSSVECFAFDNDIEFTSLSTYSITINSNKENCNYYYLYFYKYNVDNNISEKRECSVNSNPTFYQNYVFSNFNIDLFDEETNLTYNVLDFSSYMSDYIEEVEQPIITTATNLTNFMIEKSKNIYSVLIQSDKMFFCISLVVVYIAIIFTLKLIRR